MGLLKFIDGVFFFPYFSAMPEAYTHHPDDPRTLLTGDIGLVVPLMRRLDVDSVIVQRPHLRDRYKEIFNENGGQTIDNWHMAAQGWGPPKDRAIYMPGDAKEPSSIYINDTNIIEAMKEAAPTEIWNDLCTLSGIIGSLTQNDLVLSMIFQQSTGEAVKPNVRRFSRWHHHMEAFDRSVTGHVSTTDAGIDILLGQTVKTLIVDDFGEYEHVIPENPKVLSTKAADIPFFKPHVLHRTSPDAKRLGRSALSVYQSYKSGMRF